MGSAGFFFYRSRKGLIFGSTGYTYHQKEKIDGNFQNAFREIFTV
jgi:hypothetical protein